MNFTATETQPAPVKSFIPSPFQQALLDWADEVGATYGTDRCPSSVIVEAVAGSGKSSSLEQMLRRLPARLKIIAVSFNKKIEVALRARMPSNVDCSTVNGMGHRALCRWLQGLGVRVGDLDANRYKERDILRAILTADEGKAIGAQVAKLVEMAKAHGLVPVTALSAKVSRYVVSTGCLTPDVIDAWEDLVNRYGIDVDNEQELARIIVTARQVLATSMEMSLSGRIYFDDQVFCTVAFGCSLPQYDVVAGDEVQDWNMTDRALVRGLMARNRDGSMRGRLIAVGDRMQSIYTFRGADAHSMDRIAEEFGCQALPLSITYRCPLSHVREAQKLVPAIQATPWAQEGVLGDLETFAAADFRPDDGVICRKTAPLVGLAYQLLAARVPCQVLGRKIGQGLITLIEKMRARTLEDLDEKLSAWEAREVGRLTRKGEDDKVQGVQDKVQTILIILGTMRPGSVVRDLIAEISGMFSSDDPRPRLLTLCTIHRAKGLEWDTVYILDRHEMPARWARTADAKQEELNCLYVAITRSKEAMFYIASGTMVERAQDGQTA